jgi:hypothetical protein
MKASNVIYVDRQAEVERGRQIEAGHPPDREPFLPHREAPKTA